MMTRQAGREAGTPSMAFHPDEFRRALLSKLLQPILQQAVGPDRHRQQSAVVVPWCERLRARDWTASLQYIIHACTSAVQHHEETNRRSIHVNHAESCQYARTGTR